MIKLVYLLYKYFRFIGYYKELGKYNFHLFNKNMSF
jgi:hypothetical protein